MMNRIAHVYQRRTAGSAAISRKWIIFRDASRKPSLHFVLNPAHRMCSDFHPHRELTLRLQLVTWLAKFRVQ
jgi:hypothetical protein